MKFTPQRFADIEEYPELRRLHEQVLPHVAAIMAVHDIGELLRIHKTGIFDHPLDKDAVSPIGIPGVPSTVAAARYTVGKAILDYLETIGVRGMTLGITKDDVPGIRTLWMPKSSGGGNPAVENDVTPEPLPDGDVKTGSVPDKDKEKEGDKDGTAAN